jgi:hypothetical protein
MSQGPPRNSLPFLDRHSKSGVGQIIGFALLICGSIASRLGVEFTRPLFLAGGLILVVSALIQLWPSLRTTAAKSESSQR